MLLKRRHVVGIRGVDDGEADTSVPTHVDGLELCVAGADEDCSRSRVRSRPPSLLVTRPFAASRGGPCWVRPTALERCEEPDYRPPNTPQLSRLHGSVHASPDKELAWSAMPARPSGSVAATRVQETAPARCSLPRAPWCGPTRPRPASRRRTGPRTPGTRPPPRRTLRRPRPPAHVLLGALVPLQPAKIGGAGHAAAVAAGQVDTQIRTRAGGQRGQRDHLPTTRTPQQPHDP